MLFKFLHKAYNEIEIRSWTSIRRHYIAEYISGAAEHYSGRQKVSSYHSGGEIWD
jgi:hypothetical protein